MAVEFPPTSLGRSHAFIEEFGEYENRYEELVFKAVPFHRSYEINAAPGPYKGVTVVFKSRTGTTVDLLERAPEGVRFRPFDRFVYLHYEKTIGYAPHLLKYRGSGLLLLHELGHAKTYVPEKDTIRLKIFQWSKVFDRFHHQRARNEKNAWIWALNKGAELEARGINVLSEFGSSANIRQYIHFAMYTNDYCALNQLRYHHESLFLGDFPNRSYYSSQLPQIDVHIPHYTTAMV